MALSLPFPDPGNQGTLEPALDSSGAIVNNGPMAAPPYRLSSFWQGVKDAPQMDFSPCRAEGCMAPASPLSRKGQLCQLHGGQ